jgi:hypothetical protein
MADKPSCKGIAGAGRIEYFFQGQGRRDKDLVLVEEQGAMLAFLDDQITGAHFQDGAGCLYQGKLSC